MISSAVCALRALAFMLDAARLVAAAKAAGSGRLRIRWEIRDDIHEAFLSLACSIICWRRLTNLSLC